MVEFAKEVDNTRRNIEKILGPMGVNRRNWLEAMKTVIEQLAVSPRIADLAEELANRHQIPKRDREFSALCLATNLRQEPQEWERVMQLEDQRQKQALSESSEAA